MLTIRLCHLQIGLIGLLPFQFLFFKKFPCLIILAKIEHYVQVEGIETLVFPPILEEVVYFSLLSLMFSADLLSIFLNDAPSVSSFFRTFKGR